MCHASEFLHLKSGRGAAINYRNAGYVGRKLGQADFVASLDDTF